uniref:Uncharacterized protein n=1 Tax=Carcinus maenas virus 1 TaxID=2704945 RepID=A0A6G9HEP3_9VIRU|nr:hypothetical protein [Carcinus maenas virus 1]
MADDAQASTLVLKMAKENADNMAEVSNQLGTIKNVLADVETNAEDAVYDAPDGGGGAAPDSTTSPLYDYDMSSSPVPSPASSPRQQQYNNTSPYPSLTPQQQQGQQGQMPMSGVRSSAAAPPPVINNNPLDNVRFSQTFKDLLNASMLNFIKAPPPTGFNRDINVYTRCSNPDCQKKHETHEVMALMKLALAVK